MLRLMFDSNGYDALADNPLGLANLRSLVHQSEVEVLATHVQEGEISAISDVSKREALLSICRTLDAQISTDGAVWNVSKWNVSKWNEAKWGPESGDVSMEKIHSVSSNQGEDALIAATASREVDVLVTDDKRLRNRIAAQGSTIGVWTFAELLRYMDGLTPP